MSLTCLFCSLQQLNVLLSLHHFSVWFLFSHEIIDIKSISISVVCFRLCLSQVLVPSLLVPSQGAVCHMCVQSPVCPQHPLLLLLQRSSPDTAAHEHLLVPG